MIAPPPAADAFDAPQAAATLNKTNQQIGIDAASERRNQAEEARRQRQFAASLYSKGLRIGGNGQPEPIPGWVDPTKATDATGKPDLAAVRAEAIDKIKLARTLQQRSRDGWFTTGAGANIARLIGGSPAYDVRQDTETLKNAGALTRIMEMAKTNGGKNPLTPLSNSDFQALASSLSNLETGQSDDQYQHNVQRVIDMYSRAYQGAGGTNLEGEIDPAKRRKVAPGVIDPVAPTMHSFTPNNVIDFAAGISGGKYAFNDKRELTYNGKPVDVSADVMNSDQYAKAYRARFGEDSPLTVDVVGGQRDPSSSEMERRRDTFVGGADAVVRGVADTATLGLADPLAALARSALNEDGFAANLKRERAISAADEEVNPYLRFGGQMAGAVPTFAAISRLGAAAVPARPFFGTAMTDTTAGAIYGGTSNMETSPVAGALVGGATALAGNQLGQRVISPFIERALSSGQAKSAIVRALIPRTRDVDTAQVRSTLTDAERLGIPMSLADADPKLRTIAGSATRLAPAGREYAERVIEPRGRAQAERAISAIERDFGPTVDVGRTADDLISRGNAASSPLYRQAYEAPVVSTPELDQLLNTPAGRAALSRARTIAANERRDPEAMGFALDADNNVVLNPVNLDPFQRQAEAKAGFDAAQEAHRVAMRTSGADASSTRAALLSARDDLQAATPAVTGRPAEGTAATQRGYTTQTLDYVKRGLDDILEENRDSLTGRLQLDEYLRSVNQVRGQLVSEVDRLNPGYRAARQAYQGPARERDALKDGYAAVAPRMKPDSMSRVVERLPEGELGQYRSGYRTGMAEQVEGMRLSHDPYAAVWGTPDQMAKAGMLFPDGVSNFSRQVELEKLLAKTQQETLGGSPTAGRRAADEMFGPGMGMQVAGEATLGALTGVPPISAISRALTATVRDRARLGVGGSKKAASIAELLLDPSPAAGMSTIDALIAQEIARSRALAIGGSAGAAGAVPFFSALGAE
ncbi:hypothetical protein [Sphingomonas endolithica]|uniref:hypothetical protein n=1 Tax=Sphingomonas endolithica TaxID=2972485 RepID=UPI0021AF520C|nr:hypothetical protein [Sphingomonas sp. ZFBP2030]